MSFDELLTRFDEMVSAKEERECGQVGFHLGKHVIVARGAAHFFQNLCRTISKEVLINEILFQGPENDELIRELRVERNVDQLKEILTERYLKIENEKFSEYVDFFIQAGTEMFDRVTVTIYP